MVSPYLATLPVPVTASHGDWVRQEGITSNGVPRKWHRFTGDLAWCPTWSGINVVTPCSVSLNEFRREFATERPAEDVCRRSRGRRAGPLAKDGPDVILADLEADIEASIVRARGRLRE